MGKLIMWNLMTLDGFYEDARSFDLPLSADQLRTLDGASHIELGFPYELYAKDMPRAFAYGGMRDRILACFCREHPDVGLKVIAVVGSRLRRLVGIIEELSFTTVRQRLVALVLRLAQADGTPSKEGIRVELAKSHQDLAAELGTVRELVSRNLSRLQAEGFLDVEGRKIVVKDLPGLKREHTSAE
jgi:hypothetical protein